VERRNCNLLYEAISISFWTDGEKPKIIPVLVLRYEARDPQLCETDCLPSEK